MMSQRRRAVAAFSFTTYRRRVTSVSPEIRPLHPTSRDSTLNAPKACAGRASLPVATIGCCRACNRYSSKGNSEALFASETAA
jgi:hypothetical protein